MVMVCLRRISNKKKDKSTNRLNCLNRPFTFTTVFFRPTAEIRHRQKGRQFRKHRKHRSISRKFASLTRDNYKRIRHRRTNARRLQQRRRQIPFVGDSAQFRHESAREEFVRLFIRYQSSNHAYGFRGGRSLERYLRRQMAVFHRKRFRLRGGERPQHIRRHQSQKIYGKRTHGQR